MTDWLSLAIGGGLTVATALCALLIASFYHESRLEKITQVWALIDGCRQMKGLKPLAQTERPPVYIQNAANDGLGTNNPSAIQLISYDVASYG